MPPDHAPVVLFAHSRPAHLRRTLAALARNPLAGETDLIVFSDGARTPEQAAAVQQVRACLDNIGGFRSVVVHRRPANFGLARSVIEGVSEVLRTHARLVVLEDDMETSPHFLAYMNEALDRYAADDRVASIHGWCFPSERPLPEAFFMAGAECWGWATWRRGWELFEPDGAALLRALRSRRLVREFDVNDSYPYTRMLEDQIAGKNDSWAIRWRASAFLAGKLSLHPGRTLVHNIGNDASGVHCDNTTKFDSPLSETPIDLSQVVVEPSEAGFRACEHFFRTSFPRRRRFALFGHDLAAVARRRRA